jgi:hypothetical protein
MCALTVAPIAPRGKREFYVSKLRLERVSFINASVNPTSRLVAMGTPLWSVLFVLMNHPGR